MIQFVDLAAKFSAGMLRNTSGEILEEFDSRDVTIFQFVAIIARNARRDDCALTLIEDVPKNPKYTQAMTKPVFQIQGMIKLACWPVLQNVLWVDPSRWMGAFPGVQRAPKGLTKTLADKARIEAARVHAEARGYAPPDLVQQYIDANPGRKILAREKAPLVKSSTDYVSAFLMSEWALDVINSEGIDALRATQGVDPSYI